MKKLYLLLLALLAVLPLHSEETDTLKLVDMEEVLVIATPKENRKLREQPAAVTLLSQKELQAAQVNSIKGLTSVVPNLFIPDYGSRVTTAIYIRGIGSRINTPSVGLYVDNIPYIDKSAFDFSYADVERIDVLRGPQGTLYGRNAMGGLIKVHTKSPFSYQGTDLRLGAATRGGYNASLTHYHRSSERFAFSTGGFYDYEHGFYRNSLTGKRVGQMQNAGGRFRGILLPADNWKADLSLSYEYSDQQGYAYFYDGKIQNDEPHSYHRNLLNAGLNIEHQADAFTLSAVTGYQWLADRMFLDQDFSPAHLFNLEQKQRMQTLSEEVVLKSRATGRWQWTTGAFLLYQWLKTDGPVTFHRDGISQVIEANVNSVFDALASRPGVPQMHLGITNDQLRVGGRFRTPTLSAALFHQSTINNLFVKGLSATIGLRLDYEKMRMEYDSQSSPTLFDFTLTMPNRPVKIESKGLEAGAAYVGELSTDYVQLLPKFALQYEWSRGNNLYLTATRGYRSGGYNIQMFSDLATGALRNSMMDALAADKKFASMATMIEQMKQPVPTVEETTHYRPEYSWNYEVGTHLTLADRRLLLDLSAFLMQTRDQQIAKFAEQGLGRVTVNAGRSRSLGAEAALNALLTDRLSLNLAYGYTHATFRNYATGETVSSNASDATTNDAGATTEEVNLRGNRVPFVPEHTLNVGAQYTLPLRTGALLDRIVLGANYSAAGRIYWTEQNDAWQDLYGTLNGRISLEKGNGAIQLWVRNATNTHYDAFHFVSMGRAISQPGRPIQAGIEVRCRF